MARNNGVWNFSGGNPLYIGLTSGAIVQNLSGFGTGDLVRIVGHSINGSLDIIYFNPDSTWIIRA
jgi:hypothetical protein